MATPEVIEVIDQFRRRLLALDAASSAQLIQAYGPIWTQIRGDLDSLLAQVQNQQLSFAQVQKIERYNRLLAEVRIRVDRYAIQAEGFITNSQRASVGLAEDRTRAVVEAALPPRIDFPLLARLDIRWTRLPAEAFEAFIGFSGDGAPLARILEPLGATASRGVRDGIAEGIALGRSPRETARLVRQKFGVPLTDSLRISRTETLRAFRESTRMQYAANSNIVKGYARRSARDDRVCMACLALDGKRYANNEPLDEHVNGRCAMVPVTLTYRDLGLNVDTPPGDTTTSRDWFADQGAGTQRRMMGPGRFDAWNAGQFELTDMAKVTSDPVWGDSAVVKPLKELV